MNSRTIRLLTLQIIIVSLLIPIIAAAQPVIEINYFYGKDCPHCQALNPIIDEIEADHPNLVIHRYEVYYNDTNYEIFDEFRDRYGIKVGGVPVIFFNDTYLSGDITKEEIEREIARIEAGETDKTPESKVSIPFLIISGIVNGLINLCTFAVFILLLTSLLILNDRRKIIIIGITFIIAVYLTYLLVGVGLINTFLFAGTERYIRSAVIIIALLAGVINIRDFFTGESTLAIPKFAKPGIKRMIEYASLPTAGVLGVFATLVGLPCTVGVYLPVLTALSAEPPLQAILYLLFYNIIYILPLFGIIALVYFGTDPEELDEMRESKKRYVRLFGGIVILSIGILMLIGVI
ncbi:MAG: cytochrome c biogenesis protein, transmembrane region [Candidatus Syntrophoarchaeum caldarius]|uniref:Cytochrome c biogenesis protein, transmembrane region n=1 Tax=Candidatus Syntropharchaeum caldarium TaxID=1838285 RepID=A0A1F2PBG2_9EURY|nr:MAG: cytochrome c biogenesis protein, transmembrane region [Candidatus Syntrophoarchaeum caldarius]